MTLLNPALLWGLSALMIPFIVLLLFRKKIVLQWAAYEWMAKASVKKHKQNLLDDILKLLAKLLLLLFLVLLMARPSLPSAGGGSRLVVIDTTPSMATVLDNGTRLSRARELVKAFLEQAEGASAVAAFDGTLTPLAPLSDSPDPAAVDAAVLTGNTGGFDQLVMNLLALENLSATPEVLFFTDAQRVEFDDPAAIARLMESLAPTRIVLIPVDLREESVNIGITRVEPPAEGVLPGRANALQVTVRNFSDQPADAVPVSLTVNDTLQDRVTISLPPGSEQTVDLLVSTPPGRAVPVTVSLPPDLFPLDDTWHLVADPPSRLRVLAVTPPPGENPFEADVFFRSALRAFVPEDHLVYQQVRPQQLLTLPLQNYDAVVTFGIPLTEGNPLADLLADFVNNGGSLLAFLDPDRPGTWMGAEWTAAPEDRAPAAPDPERLADGVLAFMTAPGLDASRIRFLRYTPLRAEAAEGLLVLEQEPTPVALRLERGRGRVILAGFLPYTGYTDLIYNPNFVQTAIRLLRAALPETGIHSYTGRELAHIRVPALQTGAAYTLQYNNHPSISLDLQQPTDGDPFLAGEVLTENAFATVLENGTPLLQLGYNLTRTDSDIRAATPVSLEPVLSDQLTLRSDADTPGRTVQLETTGLMAFLLLIAIGFDTYAHLWRRA